MPNNMTFVNFGTCYDEWYFDCVWLVGTSPCLKVKHKGKGLPITCHAGTTGVEVQLHSVLMLTLGGSRWSTPCPNHGTGG
jgi:hypothetical protein